MVSAWGYKTHKRFLTNICKTREVRVIFYYPNKYETMLRWFRENSEMLSAKWWTFCISLNVLNQILHTTSKYYMNGLMQDSCNSILNALGFPQHCGKLYWYIPYKTTFSTTLHPSFQYGAFYYFPIQSIQLHHSTGNFTTCQGALSDLRHIKILNRTATTNKRARDFRFR